MSIVVGDEGEVSVAWSDCAENCSKVGEVSTVPTTAGEAPSSSLLDECL